MAPLWLGDMWCLEPDELTERRSPEEGPEQSQVLEGSAHSKWPHNCGTYGVVRAARMRVSTALSLRSMVRMGPPGRIVTLARQRSSATPGYCGLDARP
jgi:hypothetical protein